MKEYIPIIISILAVSISGYSLYIANKAYSVQNRPYVGIEKYNTKILTDGAEFEAIIVNRGTVPANNLTLKFTGFTNGVKDGEAIVEEHFAHLMSSPDFYIYNFRKAGLEGEWEVEFIIQYDGVNTKNHETYIRAKYKKDVNRFSIIKSYVK